MKRVAPFALALVLRPTGLLQCSANTVTVATVLRTMSGRSASGKLPVASLKLRVNENRRFLRVPIVQVVRRELVMPAKFSGLHVEGENAVGV